jgi:ubiquinone/menaquinone biosynthesis C-methylase UbiE
MRGHLLVGSSPLEIVPRVLSEIRGNRVLDVGCGCGVYGYLLRNKWQDTYPGRVQFEDFARRDPANDQPQLLAGVDVQVENVRRCARHSIFDFLALARAQELPFPDNYVDTVLCIEVLEHLPPAEALRAIRSFERIARQRIVITVPKEALDEETGRDERGFLRLDSDDPEVREWVEAETHKSSFSIRELKRLGFRVGREVGSGWRAPARALLRLWENHGPRSGQILAVKELNKPGPAVYASQVPAAPAQTEGFPDYRGAGAAGQAARPAAAAAAGG